MRAALGSIVKHTAAAFDRARPRQGTTFLLYHRVGGATPSAVDLPTVAFRDQMAVLRDRFRVLDIDEALAELAGGDIAGDPSRPAVVVTFDDGTTDLVTHAAPILAEFSIPATVYVATGHVEDQRAFPDEGPPLSWAGVAELAATGLVTIGSHSHEHVLFDRITSGEAADDLDRSQELLGEHVGEPARHFAYPKALRPSPSVEAEVRRRFASAALAGTRPNPPGTDPYRLSRSPIQVADGMRWFHRKAEGGMGFEDDLRRVKNRIRYRGAVT